MAPAAIDGPLDVALTSQLVSEEKQKLNRICTMMADVEKRSIKDPKALTMGRSDLASSLLSPASSVTARTESDSELSFSDGQSSLCDDDLSHDELSASAHPTSPVGITTSAQSRNEKSNASYLCLRLMYLAVTMVIMLADGLQGTHLYVLYEGYGFSVAHLYCLGFATGGLMSPITGPLVDKIGRKKSAILYCLLEIFINMLEQKPFLMGLIVSRMIGGFTTNLLSSVFETWLDTEYRRRGFAKEKYEIIMRDSVIVSNVAAIFSGYLAHVLADSYGAVGPFQGAVSCTAVALVVVCFVWTENYGSSQDEGAPKKDMIGYFREAVSAFRSENRMLRVGLLQGLTAGSIQIFVFLWAPTLRHFALSAPKGIIGLDKDGEPAYGLIFGAYMFAGVVGGLIAPHARRFSGLFLSSQTDAPVATVHFDGDDSGPVRVSAVELLASICYFVSALMLFVPCLCPDGSSYSFTISLAAFLAYELFIGVFLPCEGVIRSLYFPADARASIMTLPRIIVNMAVAFGVVSTEYISLKTAFFAVGCLMLVSAGFQLSLITDDEWESLLVNVGFVQGGSFTQKARSFSFTLKDLLKNPATAKLLRRASDSSDWSDDDELVEDSIIDDRPHTDVVSSEAFMKMKVE